MDLSRYMTALMKLFQRVSLHSNWLRKVSSCFVEKFQSDSYLISGCVADICYGDMAMLVEFHNLNLSLVEQKLDCGQMF